MNTKAMQLFNVLLEYAPDTRAKHIVSSVFNKLRIAQEPEDLIEKHLANNIADGLNHGNWPWTETSNVT